MSAPISVTADSFRSQVVESDKPVIVDFWATWCGPCRMLSPILDEVAADYEGKAVIAKVNVDENPALASMFQVMSIPTLIFFKDGKKVAEFQGVQPKEKISKTLDGLL